ncbi:hypothetical protein [Desulfocurvibacter africanus]|uniref:hypothetical protein n=1 Tax=Desulfocurvibacter africanus TaxID=873 RepID=UPI0004217AF7|nr:hypothetical protein [Desulfocurvibacter africanus]
MALWKDAHRIKLLDEPSTGIDSATERDVISVQERLCSGRAGIIVTHQLSTLTGVDIDAIHILQNGKMDEDGLHEEPISRRWSSSGEIRGNQTS